MTGKNRDARFLAHSVLRLSRKKHGICRAAALSGSRSFRIGCSGVLRRTRCWRSAGIISGCGGRSTGGFTSSPVSIADSSKLAGRLRRAAKEGRLAHVRRASIRGIYVRERRGGESSARLRMTCEDDQVVFWRRDERGGKARPSPALPLAANCGRWSGTAQDCD